jgi:hypothetical protein
MPFLKRDAPTVLVDLVSRIEAHADACHLNLSILNIPSNVALWALLTGGVQMLETAGTEHNEHSKDFSIALVNAGRSMPIAMKWVAKRGRAPSTLAKRHWTPGLASRAIQALLLADQYSAFCTCFPMWHQNRYLAEAVSESLVWFIAPGGERHRQVSAHLKGFRTRVGDWKVESPKPPQQIDRQRDLFALVLETSRKTGAMRFEYNDPWVLWSELLPDYQARVAGITRRPDSISLGPYIGGAL